MKNKILAALIAILAFGQGAMAASTWSLTSTTSSGTTTFTITRSSSTAAETVHYRTVSLSALEGQHFTAVSGSLTFTAGQTSKTVTVTEAAPSDAVYKVYSSTTRQYRFELLDVDGTMITQCDRNVSGGTQFTDTYLNNSITGLTYFDKYGDGSLLSGATHYLDVANSGSAGTWVKVGDGGYSQAVHTISTGTLYNNNSTLRTYLNSSGTKMYATVYFTQKEDQDGYQYIQILADNSSTYDGSDPNGAVNTPSTSLYKACFILSYDPSGSVETNPHTQFFPHRWDYADRNAQYSGNSWNWQEFDYDNAHLYEQEFKSATPSLRAENSGSLVLAPTVNNINVRFDAAGSGGDDWYFKDLKVRLALVDATAPTVLNNYKVSGGRHQKGNIIYVSVPFSELVTVDGTPTLTTTWGTLNYTAGSGSNVLTFSGAIAGDASGTFSVSALSGIVKDLAGNAFSGTVSKDFGTTLDTTYEWSLSDLNQVETNTYEIATKPDLYRLANIVNISHNECNGMTFRQTQDIVCDAEYTPIGYYIGSSDQASFSGTYNGQGHTVSGITVTRTGNTSADGYIGLFGYVSEGTVENVVLANSTLTGYDNTGGIVGYLSNGTVRNCRVESSVTIKAGYNMTGALGGIVGAMFNSEGNVIGCISSATINSNGKSGCKSFGGIVGYKVNGALQNCFYTGTSVSAENKYGAIVGTRMGGTITNNYYTAISLGGVGGNGDSSTSSDQDGARRARTVTLGEGVALAGGETTYDVSGLTAIGTSALRTSDGTIYSGEGQTLTLSYSGTAPTGYQVTYSVNGTPIDGNSFTMPAGDVTVSVSIAPDLATYWHADVDHDGTTEARAYIISTTTGLDLLATKVNEGVTYEGIFFKLGADITYTSTTAWDNTDVNNEANNFTAIGGTVSNINYPFSGTFDGDGHTVSGIRIAKKSRERLGLFGYVRAGGTIKNLTLSNARIYSNTISVGGIAGSNSGTITNCHVADDVNILGNGGYHGGIAGSSSGNITGCTSAATLNWRGYNRGGITGQISGTVSNCLVTGLSYNYSSEFAGTIVGKKFNSGTLSKNYYLNCSVNSATTNIGVGSDTAGVSSDVIENDGAVHATAYVVKPTEIGSQTASYPGGITVYEHGLAWQGKYYMASGTSVSLNLTAHSGTLAGQTHYWATFYHPNWNYTLPAGAKAYIVKEDKNLYRVGDGTIIPAGVAVVIMAESASLTLTATNANAPAVVGNILQGSDSAVPVAGLSGTPYVLGKVGDVLGFYQCTGTSIPAGKAYYVVTP